MERLDSFAELLRETFPARSELASLEFVAVALRDDRAVIATIRLVVWERADDGTLAIRDVKEQEMLVCTVDELDDLRLPACVAGSQLALEHVLAQDDLEWIETCLPSDLLRPYSELLRLKRPRTAEDYAEALLASRQRLGRFLRS